MDNLFSSILLEWYKVNKRDLPWRSTSDPYMIWVSEIILQQTRVVQGYEYFLRFVARFPDVRSLAEASEEEVMKYWQGLGYYSRARNLHAAARSMTNAEFPKTYAEVRNLKGVGDYTAAAICSIAYNMPYAVVDGNVYRVLSRYLGVDVPIDSIQGKKYFSALAFEMLDKEHPADYNQAIMDFGANKTLTGGLSLQTAETYKEFISTDHIFFGGNNFELYFEEDDFDRFAEKLKGCNVEYVHPIKEHSWGQRVVRFYDPDMHIIEVGENMKVVCKRFLNSGMTPEQMAERMNVPLKFVKACMR